MTYRPFAETPAVEELAKDLQMNVSETERYSSGALGAALLLTALLRGGLLVRLPLLLLGGSLLYRAYQGYCAGYARMGVDTRHPHSDHGVN